MARNQDDSHEESLEALKLAIEFAKLAKRLEAGDISAIETLVKLAKARDDDDIKVLGERAKRGIRSAFAELAKYANTYAKGNLVIPLERNYTKIMRYIHNLIYDKNVIEDLTQETFLRAWKFLPNLNDPSRFDAWIKRIGKNVVFDYLRRLRWGNPPYSFEEIGIDMPDEFADPDKFVPELQYYQDIVRAVLKRFSEKHQKCFLYRTYTQLSAEEIGKMLDISAGTVRVYYSEVSQTAHTAMKILCVNCQAELAATRLDNLPLDRLAAFEAHFECCTECFSVQLEYREIDELAREVLSPDHLLGVGQLGERQTAIKLVLESSSQKHQDCFRLRIYERRSVDDTGKELNIDSDRVSEYVSLISHELSKVLKQASNKNERGDESNGRGFMR